MRCPRFYRGGRFEASTSGFATTAIARAAQVRGRTGMALVFEHALTHEGAEVTGGTKYVLRSDVMYGPVGQIAG
jgi:hypothetical protein